MSHFAHLKLLTKADAADILGVCTKTVDNYIREGLLPSPRPLGSREYWHPQAFERFLAQHFGLSDEGAPQPHAGDLFEAPKPEPKPTGVRARSPKRPPAVRQAARQAEVLRELNE